MLNKYILRLLSVFSLVSFLFFNLGTSALAISSREIKTPSRVSGQVLVKFKDGTSDTSIQSELRNQNSQILRKINRTGTLVLNVSDKNVTNVIASLKRNPRVEYVEEDAIATVMDYPTTSPNDEYYTTNQWGLENTGQIIAGSTGTVDADIDAQDAWKVTTGSSVAVAILDTGIDESHPDLAGKVIQSQNFSNSPSVDDFFGHGTHVSGIVAANTNNTTGTAGVCPDCTLLNVKVLGDTGSGSYSGIASGITWAADNGAKVINMSLGGSARSSTLEAAVKYAWSKGVVIVAAAGNSGNPMKIYPGSYTNVIAVASTNNKDKKSNFSSYGSWVDVAAPGENIFSLLPTHSSVMGTNYGFASGTSMATPMTAGEAALIWSTPRGTSAVAVRGRLESTADRVSALRSYVAKGRINAGRAVAP